MFPSSLCVNPDFQLVSVLYFLEDSFNISCNIADEVFKHFNVSVQFSLCLLWFFATPWIAACQASLSIPNSRSLLKLMSIDPTMSCHPTISSSVVPFSSCLQSFPVSGSFPVSQFFSSGGQNIEASALASIWGGHGKNMDLLHPCLVLAQQLVLVSLNKTITFLSFQFFSC